MGLFRRRALPSSGHPLDDRLLAELARSGDLAEPRHWVHYLYLPDEVHARAAAAEVQTAGWQLQRARHGGDHDGWEASA